MKKIISKLVIVAAVFSVFGAIGRMDYQDQQFDAARAQEIRFQVNKATRHTAALNDVCLALNSHLQHCQSGPSDGR